MDIAADLMPAPGSASAAAVAAGGFSGRQWTIATDGHEAVVTEVGGGLREYRWDGVDYVDGYGTDEVCPGSAGQILAPWPNRIRDGRFTFDGTAHQLSLTEPERHTAIHGLVNWVRWHAVEADADRVVLEHELVPQPGYPWPLLLRVTWAVGGSGLAVTHEAVNIGTAAAPFGLSVHPYLRVPGVAVDDLILEVPAHSRVLFDGRLLPIGTARVAGTEYDYTGGRRIGSAVKDKDIRGRTDFRDRVVVTIDGTTLTRLGTNSHRPTVATCAPPNCRAIVRTPAVISAAT